MGIHTFGFYVDGLGQPGPGNFTVNITSNYTLVSSFSNFAGLFGGEACGDLNQAGQTTVGGYASHIAWSIGIDTDDATFSGTIECSGITEDVTLIWDSELNAGTIPANTASFPFSFPTSDSASTPESFAALTKRLTSRAR